MEKFNGKKIEKYHKLILKVKSIACFYESLSRSFVHPMSSKIYILKKKTMAEDE